MKAKSIFYILTVLLVFYFSASAYGQSVAKPTGLPVAADSRSIYVGDIITLEITAGNFSAEDLQERFQDFEIVELQESSGVYMLSIRTFEPGEYNVPLGDKEIIITVGSTLLDIDRADIFPGDRGVLAAGFAFYWRILFYIAAGVFVLCGGYVLHKNIYKNRKKPLSPHQLFLQRAGGLALKDDNYFVYLTLYFKEYLEGLYQFRIIGKTSTEILHELNEIQPLLTMLPEIGEWLWECDRLKFTGIEVSDGQKQEHCEKLLVLAEKIEALIMDTEKEEKA